MFRGVLLLVLMLVFSLPAVAAPKLKLSKKVHSFGSVKEGEAITHEFIVKNVGDEPLEIERIQPACGCTVAEVGDKAIKPGESTPLAVTFHTAGFQGYKVKTVRIYSNDPTQPSEVLTLKGTIATEVEVSPSRLYFGSVKKGEELSREISIKLNSKSKNLKITSVYPRSEHIEAVNVSKKNKSRVVKVVLKKDAPIGVLRSRLIVKTNSRSKPVVNVPIFARIEGNLTLSPRDISFGLVRGPLTEPLTQSVTLNNSSGESVHIKSIKSSNPSLSVQVEKSGDAKGYQINVSVDESTTGPFRAEITIETDNQEQATLKLPVYGIISSELPS